MSFFQKLGTAAAPDHKLPNHSENSTTSGQALGKAVTGKVGAGAQGRRTGIKQEISLVSQSLAFLYLMLKRALSAFIKVFRNSEI